MAYLIENIMHKDEFYEEVVSEIVKSSYFQEIINNRQTYVGRIDCLVNRTFKNSNKLCINKLLNSASFNLFGDHLSCI